MAKKKKTFSCSDCGVIACRNKSGEYPKFCPTAELEDINSEMIEEAKRLYIDDEENKNIALTAAEIEGQFYCKMTRVQETVEFIKRGNFKKVGIATCVALIRETKAFTRILDANNIDYYVVGCKLAAVEKGEINIPDENKINKGQCYESMCNPILQAKTLNSKETELNIIIGLCIGHDSLFIKYSEAPVTTMVVKDRVTGHNPVQPLYTIDTVYSKLLK